MSTKNGNKISISVVIPAYNIGSLVVRAIDSVLAQTSAADEIIVVDDGSADDTAKYIKQYGDKLRYVYQSNAGLASARNAGIKVAASQWVAFLDGDDEWLIDKLKLQRELIQRNPDLRWLCGNYYRHLNNENRRSLQCNNARLKGLLRDGGYFDDFFDAFRKRATAHGNTVLIHKEVFETAGMFQDGLAFAEDIEMWFRIAMQYPKVGYVVEPLAVYYLDRAGSLVNFTQTRRKMEIVCDIIEQSLKLARKYKRNDKFLPCVRYYLRGQIRSYLFEYRMADSVKEILKRFGYVFGTCYRLCIRAMVCFPRVTASVMHLISGMVRFLNLRKITVNPPRK